MLTRRIRIQVLAFVVIALSTVAFVGASYAGLARSGFVVHLELADGGGIFTGSEVTYRGVAVGRVGELRLTDDGMEADLVIDDGAPAIPVNLQAVVANRSAIGEQYVDLQPRTGDGPFLAEGARIPRESTKLPLPVSTVLSNLSALNESVPTDALRTVVDEFYAATRDTGPSLQLLLDSSAAFTKAAAEHLPQTSALIGDGATVLRTQVDSAQEWRSFGRNAKLFAGELARSDGDLRALIGSAPQAATQLSGLLRDTDPGLAILLANLLTTANVFQVRVAGIEQLLVTTPKAVAATSTAITPDGGNLSLVLSFNNPPPCTVGYEGTQRRQGEDVTPGVFNTAAACTLPAGDPRLVRGSQHAPAAGVPPAATPGGSLPGPLGEPALPAVSANLRELLWLPN
ncbi:MAG TPA: MlaD family protein [Actinophytocola sp.]|jgi:phospholipid/cholesterol/gamma-HCH transport system substrate-binding protein|uniref:MlaD family protein n=1 Tax=Actinophytocola sp. TaxID=1872138 RepID=UPI002E01849D|nr:MlaD family protein [Actinophytocola sp.]